MAKLVARKRRVARRQSFAEALAMVDVGAVRELYEKTTYSVPEILRRTGLTEANLRTLRIREGWTARPRIAEPGARQGRKTIAARLASRIEKAALTQLAALDARLAEGATPGTQEISTMRELMRLAREADALVNISTKAAMRGSGRGSGKRGAGAERGGAGTQESDTQESEAAYVEWMRAELTRRLDCLAAESGLARDRREF